MQLEDNYQLLLDKSISKFTTLPRYRTLLKALADRLDNLQKCIDYLLDQVCIDTSEGVWLDYKADLVGTSRNIFNLLDFFCVNAPHLNVEKYFYFEGESQFTKGNLNDVLLKQEIKAQIAYNNSKCTREENQKIIKGITNADRVIIKRAEPMILDITLIGDNIFFSNGENLRSFLELALGNGVGIGELKILSSQQELKEI